jgi:hypothetical protein
MTWELQSAGLLALEAQEGLDGAAFICYDVFARVWFLVLDSFGFLRLVA